SEAVRVVATRSVPASLFAGGLFNEQVLLSAEAVSIANVPIAAFSAGTSTAELNTQDSALLNSLLSRVLGSNVNLSLVSYKGIADTNITLAQLITAQSSVANIDELLDLNLTTGELLGLVSDAMTTTSSAAAANVQVLASAATRNTIVRLGDVLNVAAPKADGVLNLGINALSLINTAVLVANGQNAITLPLAINIGGLVNTSTIINVIETPQIAIGPPSGGDGNACTIARTAQIHILSTASANVLGLAKIDLGLKVEVAQGQASLQSIEDDGSNTQVTINAAPGIANVQLTGSSGKGMASITALSLLKLAEISLNLPLSNPTGNALQFNIARPISDNLPQSKSTSTQVSSGLANALGSSTLKIIPL
ncbi:MAG TPA: TadG family pilus assembly protein, partial [Blastocatellia bacterium]|nr:TadG family pilus assembly protein [Blastocatellia bacterium]